jgi:glycosyltransferase involved in cell wall biosynthesis
MSQAEVSIVIPTRDRPEWLPRTLHSALSQQEIRHEVIIVDDGSASPVYDRLGPTARKSVRVIRHDAPQGVAVARNTGIAAARGDWLAFLDDDDLWAPTKLTDVLRAARQARAGFAFSGGVYIDQDGAVLSVEGPAQDTPDLRPTLLSRNIDFCCSNVVAKAELVRSIDGFDEGLAHLADWDFAVRLSGIGQGVALPHLLVASTLHESNMQLDEPPLVAELQRFDAKHAASRAALGVVPDRAAWLRWRIAARRRAGDRLGAARAYLELAWKCRDPVLFTRGLFMGLGGERAMDAGRRVAGTWRPAAGLPRPLWLDRAVDPPPDALDEIWR